MKIKHTFEENGQTLCGTCCRPVVSPARRIVDGKIVEGCVSEAHTGQLPAMSETARWHNRPEAKKIRRGQR